MTDIGSTEDMKAELREELKNLSDTLFNRLRTALTQPDLMAEAIVRHQRSVDRIVALNTELENRTDG